MRLAISLLLIFVSLPAAALEVTNVKFGLVCSFAEPQQGVEGWVCHQTDDIFLTDQSRCVYDRTTMPCTWFGFEFDYTAQQERVKLQCLTETSHPKSSGNPSGVLAGDVTSSSFSLELERQKGHFFNPMYYIFAVRPRDETKVIEKITCKAGDTVIFQKKFNLHFPETPK